MENKLFVISGGLRTKDITKHSQNNIPLITVVTVVRNRENTLEETMVSVINQSYTNIEYIVVDGSSTDGTLDIIKKYTDKIDYWISEPDNGIYDAMNKGIGLATGEWILLLNSDDALINKDVFTNISKKLENTKADIIHGNQIVIYPNGRRRLSIPKSEDYLLKCMCINHGTCFVRKKLYDNQKYDCRYKISADYNFLLWCYTNKYIFEYINTNIILFSSSGISGSPTFGNLDAYKIWKEYHGFCKAICYFLKDFMPKIIKVPIKLFLIKISRY